MSKENNYHHLAQKILELCGGKSNISSYTHCMTRLRITPYDESKADAQALRKLDGVLGSLKLKPYKLSSAQELSIMLQLLSQSSCQQKKVPMSKKQRPKRKPISIGKMPLLLNFSYVKLPAFLSLLFPL